MILEVIKSVNLAPREYACSMDALRRDPGNGLARAVCSLFVCGGVVLRRESGRVYEEKREETHVGYRSSKNIYKWWYFKKVIIGMETWEIKFSLKIRCR